MTDEEIGSLHTQGRIVEWHAALAQQSQVAKFVPAEMPKDFVTRASFNGLIASLPGTVAKAISSYIKRDELDPAMVKIGKETREAIDHATTSLATRVANLEFKIGALGLALGRSNPEGAAELEKLIARVKALEDRPTMKYKGVWSEHVQCDEGNIVSDHGSAWHCNRSTRSRPGTNDDFTLMVKRGGEGKGSR